MLTGTLTEAVQPYELGARAASLQGRIPLSSFARLGALIERGDEAARVALQFALDQMRDSFVSTVAHELRVSIHLVLVRSDADATAMMGVADCVVLGGEPIALAALLEDDLILSLPEIVCGRLAACPNRPQLEYGENTVAASPFSALAKLIRDQ